MSAHNRKLKVITLDVGGERFEIQCKSWKMNNNSEDGEKQYTYAPDGEFSEDSDPDYALDLSFFADWRVDGVSDFLTVHDNETLTFQLDHHPDIPGEHVRWNGNLKIKAPSVGGDVRTTEVTETTLQCVGKPVYSRP